MDHHTHSRKVLALFVAEIAIIFPSFCTNVLFGRYRPAHDRQNSGFYASLQSPPMVPWFTRKMDERFEFSRAFQMRPLFYSSDTYHLISAHRRFNAFRFYRSTRTARAARLYPANRPNRFNAIQTRFSLLCGHHLLGTVYQ